MNIFTYKHSFLGCLLLICSNGWAQNNNDCINATPICSDDNISLNPTGPGSNDFSDPDNFDGCLSGENQSGWYYFEIQDGAPPNLELGFIINPDAGAGQDYDFAVFGPDVACDDLGSPIRCSYAGGGCALCPQTGLGMGANDTSEPPFGNGFVRVLTVNPGEGYYLLIDNFSNNSTGFSLSWTGSAAPWLNCILCDAEAGTLDATPNPACPGSTITVNATDFYDDPAYTQLLLIADDNGDFVDIIPGASGTLTSAECAVFTVYSYNYETAGGSFVPSVGDNVSSIDCTIECCDLEELAVSFEDDEDPTFSGAPGDVTLTCVDDVPLMTDQQWDDNCDGSGVVSGMETGSADACNGGTITRTWEYTDACGNTGQHQQVITVEPAPEADFISPPADVTISCSAIPSGPGPDLNYTNNATGACEISGTVSPVQSGSADLCGGTITYTWETTDPCGRPINYVQNITVEPASEASILSPPSDVTIDCSDIPAGPGPDLNYTNNETGSCEISGTLSPVQSGTADLCGGTITYTWDTNDACGRPINHTQTITVNPAPEANFINTPASVTVDCNNIPAGPGPDLDYTNGETGDCEIAGTVSPVQSGTADECGGVIMYTWEALDDCGRPINYVQTITVTPVPQASFLGAPVSTTISCTDLATLSAPDLDYTNGETGTCEIAGTVSPVQSGTADECGGTITFTWEFTDDCGRPIDYVQTVTVTPAPQASFDNLPPANLTVSCADAPFGPGPDLTYSNGESGSCAINGSVSAVRNGNPDECGGTITNTWTFIDDCGRPLNYVQTITVEPAPQAAFISPPDDETYTCDNLPNLTAPTLDYTNGELGSCEIAGSVTATQDGFFDVCGGTVTFTWEFTDDCGRPISYSQEVTVLPGPPPAFVDPPPPSVTLTCDELPDDAGLELSYDNGFTGQCEIFGQVQPTVTGFAGVCGGDLTYTWNYTDDCGRTINYQQVITVEPGPEPVFVDPPPASITVSCSDYAGDPAPDLTYDNGVIGACEVFGFVSPTTFGNVDECGGNVTHIWSVTDDCGRSISYTQNITVEPAAPAAFVDPPQNGSVDCGNDFPAPPELTYTNAESGNCELTGTATANITIISGQEERYEWFFIDECSGDTIRHAQTVTQDAAPELILDTASLSICAGESLRLDTIGWADATGGTPTITFHSGSPATVGNELTNLTVAPTDTTVYFFLVTNAAGCSDEAPFTLNIEQQPNAGTDGNGTVCFERSDAVDLAGYLAGAPAAGGIWTDPDGAGAALTDATNVNFSATPAGVYRFDYIVAGAGECPNDTATVTLELLAPITITISNVTCTADLLAYDLSISGNGFLISATGGGTLVNEGNDQFSLINIPIANSVEITAATPLDAGCTTTVSVSPPDCNCPNVEPPVSNGSPLICAGADNPTLTVSVLNDQTANWYETETGGTAFLTQSTAFTPTEITPGTYTYYVESQNLVDDCTSSLRTPVSFTIAANPTGNNAELVVCDTDLDGLSAFNLTLAQPQISTDPAHALRFFSDDNAAMIGNEPLPTNFINATAFAQTLTVEITNAAGCVSFAALDLVVNIPLDPVLDITDESCADNADGTLSVGAVAGAMFSLDGAMFTTDNIFPDLAAGDYTLFAQSPEGCPSTHDFTVAAGRVLSFTTFNLTCSNNDSPSDETDDFYTLDFAVGNNLNEVGTYTIGDQNGTWGSFPYGELQTLTFPANDQPLSIAVVDDLFGCALGRQAGPLTPCSSDCLISIDALTWVCDDNGTETNPDDDFYTVSLNASAFNGSAAGTYAVLIDGTLTNVFPYGQDVTFTLPADGSTPTLTVRDTEEAFCLAEQPVGPLLSCSGSCTLAENVFNTLCDDSGTPTDPTDDTWTCEVVISGANVGDSWQEATTGLTGAYGDTVRFGPFPISAGDQSFTVTDALNPACPVSFMAPAAAPCSDECALDVTVFDLVCNDNGTVENQEDDTYDLTVNATAVNAGTAFAILIDGLPSGTFPYGTSATIMLPADDSSPTIILRDEMIPGCNDERTVGPLVACNGACSLSVMATEAICDDNGTNDPADDTFTFDLTVNGENTSGTWTAEGSDSPYGTTVTFGPYPIADGNHFFTVTDSGNPNCRQEIGVTAPATCSPTCALSIDAFSVTCNNNGTVADQADDYYDVGISASAENGDPASNFIVLVNDNEQGMYPYAEGALFTLPATGTSPRITIRDATFPGCFEDRNIGPLTPCTPPCVISATFANAVCDDNGTGANTTDDAFTFELTITGENTSGQWQSEDGNLSGAYGESVVAGPFLIADGNAVLLLTDAQNPACQTTLNVPAPAACSSCQQSVNAGQNQMMDCVDSEVPLSATTSFPGTYAWTRNDVVVGTTLGITVDEPGTYILTASYPDGCVAVDSVTVSRDTSAPRLTQIEIIPERCIGENNGRIIIEEISGGEAPYDYELNGEAVNTAGFFTRLAPGDYTVVVTDANGCQVDTLITIEPGPDLKIGDPIFLEVMQGDSGQVSVSVSVPADELESIQWTPPEQLACDTCLTTRYLAELSQNYVLEVIHENGCIATTSVYLLANRALDVYIPNVFSPNGDGTNDFMTIFAGPRVVEVTAFYIFDRWGENVFTRENFAPNIPELGWDGTLDGHPMNPQVMVFSVEVLLDSGQTTVLKGDFVLKR